MTNQIFIPDIVVEHVTTQRVQDLFLHGDRLFDLSNLQFREGMCKVGPEARYLSAPPMPSDDILESSIPKGMTGYGATHWTMTGASAVYIQSMGILHSFYWSRTIRVRTK